jgi:hypothetical protein
MCYEQKLRGMVIGTPLDEQDIHPNHFRAPHGIFSIIEAFIIYIKFNFLTMYKFLMNIIEDEKVLSIRNLIEVNS